MAVQKMEMDDTDILTLSQIALFSGSMVIYHLMRRLG